MYFDDFLQLIPKLKNIDLPAEAAHRLMWPPERARLMENIDISTLNAREAAVMILMYPRNDKACFVLIQRNSYEGVHSSQMAFPGGKKESFDVDFADTALRETNEEVGIGREEMEIVRELSSVYIPPSNFLVRPFVAICQHPPIFNPDPREVAGIVEVPLEIFLDDTIRINVNRPTSYTAETSVPAFEIDGHVVWGATAMILSEFKEVVKSLVKA